MAQWQKRRSMSMTCPSGAVCEVQRPGPEVSIKAGRIIHLFKPETAGSVEQLSDEEAARIYVFARQAVAAAVTSPKLSLDEKPDSLTPEDIPPQDFWHVFTWVMRGGPDLPVTLREGETTVEAVETFPVELSGDDVVGVNSEQVSSAAV
jgi:hypothetical protein